jgi:hypothetical protein
MIRTLAVPGSPAAGFRQPTAVRRYALVADRVAQRFDPTGELAGADVARELTGLLTAQAAPAAAARGIRWHVAHLLERTPRP